MKTIKINIVIILIMIIITNNYIFADMELNLTCNSAILMDQTTHRILYGKNERKRVKIASTTKILTAIVALENSNLDSIATISKKAALTGGSTVGITSGSEVKLESLLYGMLLKSGNDCAVAIAEHVGGNVENFVAMMNEKAYQIGAKDSHFTNPHGLDTEDNYSTAYDLALITCYAKQNETLSKILGTTTTNKIFGKSDKYLANTNRLLFTYEYCDGGKTGFTNIAEKCLVATAKKEDLKIVAVILGAKDSDTRFIEGKNLLKYGIENFKMVDISEDINWYIDIPVYKGNMYSYVKKFDANLKLPLKENEIEDIYISQDIIPSIQAPLEKGSYLGKITLNISNEQLYSQDIYLEEDILKNNVWDYILLGFRNIFSTI